MYQFFSDWLWQKTKSCWKPCPGWGSALQLNRFSCFSSAFSLCNIVSYFSSPNTKTQTLAFLVVFLSFHWEILVEIRVYFGSKLLGNVTGCRCRRKRWKRSQSLCECRKGPSRQGCPVGITVAKVKNWSKGSPFPSR